MPSTLPDGEAAPSSGVLPADATAELGRRPLGVYLHVPFCATRCGYCDFNTYTAAELGSGVRRDTYVDSAIAELRLARAVLGDADLPVHTVFVGGGTPTELPTGQLTRLLAAVAAEFGLAPGAEVTTEANPESLDRRTLDQLLAAGFTRVSIGMQSAEPSVLSVLDRVHTPGGPVRRVAEAHAAGFEHVNLDLIYGTPGETDAQWLASLAAAIDAGPDHVSAYALIVEPGTRLATRIRRGELAAPDDDVLADRYLMADQLLTAAGFGWYEVSNWAATPAGRCRHNLLYWTGAHWWGVGPGAHSHIGGVRWWNVKHPAAYADRLAAGASPAAARERLGAEDRRVERVMLELRLAEGCPLDILTATGRKAAAVAVDDGLLERIPHSCGRAVLTTRGRLLADAVVRALTD